MELGEDRHRRRKGLTDHAPATDEDWAEVRRHALIVSEAANLLLMPDRPVAPPGAPSLAPGIELTPEEIRALIDKNPGRLELVRASSSRTR